MFTSRCLLIAGRSIMICIYDIFSVRIKMSPIQTNIQLSGPHTVSWQRARLLIIMKIVVWPSVCVYEIRGMSCSTVENICCRFQLSDVRRSASQEAHWRVNSLSHKTCINKLFACPPLQNSLTCVRRWDENAPDFLSTLPLYKGIFNKRVPII